MFAFFNFFNKINGKESWEVFSYSICWVVHLELFHIKIKISKNHLSNFKEISLRNAFCNWKECRILKWIKKLGWVSERIFEVLQDGISNSLMNFRSIHEHCWRDWKKSSCWVNCYYLNVFSKKSEWKFLNKSL